MAVYFIQAGQGGPVKIGLARNPRTRTTALQVGHYEKLTLIRQIDGGRKTEAWLHGHFTGLRIRGEWFRFASQMLSVEPPEFDPLVLNRRVTQYRQRHGLTREQLGGLVGVGREAVRLWEIGERQPSPKLAILLEEKTGGEIPKSALRPDLWPASVTV